MDYFEALETITHIITQPAQKLELGDIKKCINLCETYITKSMSGNEHLKYDAEQLYSELLFIEHDLNSMHGVDEDDLDIISEKQNYIKKCCEFLLNRENAVNVSKFVALASFIFEKKWKISVAKQLNISPRTLRHWLAGTYNMPPKIIEELLTLAAQKSLILIDKRKSRGFETRKDFLDVIPSHFLSKQETKKIQDLIKKLLTH